MTMLESSRPPRHADCASKGPGIRKMGEGATRRQSVGQSAKCFANCREQARPGWLAGRSGVIR
ncbi:hypothetical protein [Burkholderia glumae]|uniref:Uncharacterized protein n=1 Tax=Burkholderia glumae TaxID=337 RepID=A0AAP9XW53_BURGL|nr:hypothetical protein [Burkholderia glumae]MCM2485038.1 hypothetical protein [Burkholderia glumae]MCM2510731.1 hypothetical protein [Burkholderia glumae]QPQ89796.1 hypothetical protein I6H06_09260 [Burkholderia glumae]QQM93628.1 hypothetical protein I6G78_29000 [Burkholderia glumae]USS42074.1 hypothetical protein NFI99_07425 [Burkholderia glumae]